MFFTQFNVGKRKLAWDMLCYDITHAKRKQHSIFLITEPYLLKSGRCPKLPPGYISYGEKFSRGIIFETKSEGDSVKSLNVVKSGKKKLVKCRLYERKPFFACLI